MASTSESSPATKADHDFDKSDSGSKEAKDEVNLQTGWQNCVAECRFFIDRVAEKLDPTEALKLAILSASCYKAVCD